MAKLAAPVTLPAAEFQRAAVTYRRNSGRLQKSLLIDSVGVIVSLVRRAAALPSVLYCDVPSSETRLKFFVRPYEIRPPSVVAVVFLPLLSCDVPYSASAWPPKAPACQLMLSTMRKLLTEALRVRSPKFDSRLVVPVTMPSLPEPALMPP